MARSRACHAARHLHAHLRDDAHPGSLDNLTRGSRTEWQATAPAVAGKEIRSASHDEVEAAAEFGVEQGMRVS